jgi:hypothetical protein
MPCFDSSTTFAFQEHMLLQSLTQLFACEVPFLSRDHNLEVLQLLHAWRIASTLSSPKSFSTRFGQEKWSNSLLKHQILSSVSLLSTYRRKLYI